MMTQNPTQQAIQATAQLTVVLEAQQWNVLLAALAEAPYKVVAPLIQAVGEQLQRQAVEHAAAAEIPGNGLDVRPGA